MANQTSVRSAYANLVSVMAKCFPNNCAHLKKLPKTQNLIADWQVLVGNRRVAERDVSLFHEPPLSSLGLSRLQKEGKLSPKSTTHIWGYIDQVLESMQPPKEVPAPKQHELQLFQSLLKGQNGGNGGDAQLQNMTSMLLGGLQGGSQDWGQLLKGLPELKDGDGFPEGFAESLAAGFPGGFPGGLPNGFEGPAGLGQIFNKLAGNPGFAAMLEKVKAHLSANPELAKMAEDVRAGGPESFINLAKTFKDKMEGSDDGPRSMVDALKNMMGGAADAPEVEQNVKDMMDKLPPTFKNKIASFGKQIEESEGDSFANALSLLGQHFNQEDLTNAAELLIPNIAQLIPNPAQAAAAH